MRLLDTRIGDTRRDSLGGRQPQPSSKSESTFATFTNSSNICTRTTISEGTPSTPNKLGAIDPGLGELLWPCGLRKTDHAERGTEELRHGRCTLRLRGDPCHLSCCKWPLGEIISSSSMGVLNKSPTIWILEAPDCWKLPNKQGLEERLSGVKDSSSQTEMVCGLLKRNQACALPFRCYFAMRTRPHVQEREPLGSCGALWRLPLAALAAATQSQVWLQRPTSDPSSPGLGT